MSGRVYRGYEPGAREIALLLPEQPVLTSSSIIHQMTEDTTVQKRADLLGEGTCAKTQDPRCVQDKLLESWTSPGIHRLYYLCTTIAGISKVKRLYQC